MPYTTNTPGPTQYLVQKEAVYPLLFKNPYFIDNLLDSYKKRPGARYAMKQADSELQKMLIALERYAEIGIDFNTPPERDYWYYQINPLNTSAILNNPEGYCIQKTTLTVSFLRALGIPAKSGVYRQTSKANHMTSRFWNGEKWTAVVGAWRDPSYIKEDYRI